MRPSPSNICARPECIPNPAEPLAPASNELSAHPLRVLLKN